MTETTQVSEKDIVHKGNIMNRQIAEEFLVQFTGWVGHGAALRSCQKTQEELDIYGRTVTKHVVSLLFL